MNRPNVNYASPEWARFEEWAASELHETYRRLAALNATEQETQQLRGRAAMLDQILSFRSIPSRPE